MRKRETYIFEIGKMAVIDGLNNRGLSIVNTVQTKLLDDPERDFSSDLLYSDDRPISSMQLMQNYKEGGGGRNVVNTLLLRQRSFVLTAIRVPDILVIFPLGMLRGFLASREENY